MNAPGGFAFARISKSFAGVSVLRDVSFSVPAAHTLGLVGENGAGKSTLMNLLGGSFQPDAGHMRLGADEHAPDSPAGAMRAGVAFIHQELNLFPNLTIAENIFVDALPRRGRSPFIDRRRLNEQTSDLLARVGLPLSPTTRVERLSMGQGQLVEIAKAISRNARLVIFDEPTTSLSPRETTALFEVIGRLRLQGVNMIYVSHILADVLRLSDEIVVLRDGAVVGHGSRREFSTGRIISLMVGRTLEQLYPARVGKMTDKPILEVRALSEPHIVRDIRFTLRAGEVLGMAGLMGAGRSELARILFGLDPHASGEILLDGQKLCGCDPIRRISQGFAFLTEDRRGEGLCLDATIVDSLGLVTLREYTQRPLRLLDFASWNEAMADMGRAVKLNAPVTDGRPVGTLSGGNQQKVVLGKWLLSSPRILILDEPTRGVDVGAKLELYQLILDLADRGTGVLFISSEIEELIGICDRIMVMSAGQIRSEFSRGEFDREKIMQAALPAEEIQM